eukprot:15670952-Heterocapsa_arctica.AAC.1
MSPSRRGHPSWPGPTGRSKPESSPAETSFDRAWTGTASESYHRRTSGAWRAGPLGTPPQEPHTPRPQPIGRQASQQVRQLGQLRCCCFCCCCRWCCCRCCCAQRGTALREAK